MMSPTLLATECAGTEHKLDAFLVAALDRLINRNALLLAGLFSGSFFWARHSDSFAYSYVATCNRVTSNLNGTDSTRTGFLHCRPSLLTSCNEISRIRHSRDENTDTNPW